MFPAALEQKAKALILDAAKKGIKIATAESCTGGLISALLTQIPGSSDVLECGFVTYSNRSKVTMLNVPSYFIEDFGAVSAQTAITMAEGALLLGRANLTVAVTGIAGPGGGTDAKPVGTIYLSIAQTGKETFSNHLQLHGTRDEIRLTTVEAAIDALYDCVKKS